MDHFAKEFVMDLFLESDSVATMNRLVVAVANVVNENIENIVMYNDVMKKQHKHSEGRHLAATSKVDFYEDVILNYNDHEYEERFKIKRSTVQALINYIKSVYNSESSIIPLEKKIHTFLWLLVNDSSYSEVGALFGLHKSSVSYIFYEIASLLQEHSYDFINWPSIEEQHMTRIKINNRHKFPNCVGFIDTCKLKIGSKRKRKDEMETALLQAVCNESLMFIDVYMGEIGRLHKEKVFKMSPLSRELHNFVDFDNHILGNAKYKLRKNLITPFTCEELLTTEEMKFNEIHWRARSYIDRTFELFKARFRKLNHIDISKAENINSLVVAACVLHNFVVLHEGANEDIKQETILCEDGVDIDPSLVKTALEKRQFLCNYVNYIDGTQD